MVLAPGVLLYFFVLPGMNIAQERLFAIFVATIIAPTLNKRFKEVFGGSWDIGEIRTLEGLLFLSMCPLHQDHPQRQIAMFVTGLRILNELLNDEDMH